MYNVYWDTLEGESFLLVLIQCFSSREVLHSSLKTPIQDWLHSNHIQFFHLFTHFSLENGYECYVMLSWFRTKHLWWKISYNIKPLWTSLCCGRGRFENMVDTAVLGLYTLSLKKKNVFNSLLFQISFNTQCRKSESSHSFKVCGFYICCVSVWVREWVLVRKR